MNVGRWVGEVRDVWRSSYVDLGLILVAVGVAMMVPVILLQKVASPVVIAALGALAVPVVCWLSGVLHLICFRNAEAGESTSFGEAAAEAGARWDDVILGVALYALLLGVASILVLPSVVVGGVMLPYLVIVMVEGKGPIDALKRNVEMATGRWVDLVVYWLVFNAIVMVGSAVLMVGAVVLAMVGAFAGSPTMMFFMSVPLIGLGSFFLAPLPIIAAVGTYRMFVGESEGAQVSDAAESPEKVAAPVLQPPVAQTAVPASGVVEVTSAGATAALASAPVEAIEVDLHPQATEDFFEIERSGLAGDSIFDEDELPDGAKDQKDSEGFW